MVYLIAAKARSKFTAPLVATSVKTSGSSAFDLPLLGKKKAASTPSASAIWTSRLDPTRLVPFSYFCTCWNVSPSFYEQAGTIAVQAQGMAGNNLPTCMSTGNGDFVDTGRPFQLSGAATIT